MIVNFSDCYFQINHRSCSGHPNGGYCMETVFDDGTSVGACPLWNDQDYKDRARSLGYGDDLWQMTLEHEIAHTVIGEINGTVHSLVLWHVAHGDGHPYPEGTKTEEGKALAMMRYSRTGVRDDLLSDKEASLKWWFDSLVNLALEDRAA